MVSGGKHLQLWSTLVALGPPLVYELGPLDLSLQVERLCEDNSTEAGGVKNSCLDVWLVPSRLKESGTLRRTHRTISFTPPCS